MMGPLKHGHLMSITGEQRCGCETSDPTPDDRDAAHDPDPSALARLKRHAAIILTRVGNEVCNSDPST
jgi:hypothetical protein